MADVDCSLISNNLIKLRVDLCFGNGIKCSSRFVQDDEGRVFVKCSGKGNLLCLTAGNINTILIKVLVQRGIQLLRHLGVSIAKADLNNIFAPSSGKYLANTLSIVMLLTMAAISLCAVVHIGAV